MRRPLRALALFAALTLAACGPPSAIASKPPTPTPTPASGSASSAPQPATSGAPRTPTRTPLPSAASNAPAGSRQCAYRLTGATRNREVTDAVQAALVAGGFPNVTAQAADSGEHVTCSDNTTDFLLMNRDFGITLPVADLADREALGTQLQRLLTIAQAHATAPSNRYLVTFTANGGEERIEANATAWEQASSQGLTGAALLTALQAPTR